MGLPQPLRSGRPPEKLQAARMGWEGVGLEKGESPWQRTTSGWGWGPGGKDRVELFKDLKEQCGSFQSVRERGANDKTREGYCGRSSWRSGLNALAFILKTWGSHL